jgi:hypothetical protein
MRESPITFMIATNKIMIITAEVIYAYVPKTKPVIHKYLVYTKVVKYLNTVY